MEFVSNAEANAEMG